MNRLILSARMLAIVPALLCGSAAIASARPALSGDLQNQAVAMRYVSCLAKAAVKYDDGVSDASIVAAKITPVCADQFAHEEAAFSTGLSPHERVLYQDAVAQNQPALAANVVLDERDWNKAHRKQRVAQSN